MKRYKIKEVCQIVGVEDRIIFDFISKEWIHPVSVPESEFDEEDLTRVRLILDLMNNLAVNVEAIPIILHLVDQIHHLHIEIQNRDRE